MLKSSSWIKIGTYYERLYTLQGRRAKYSIDLDMPADRWAIYVNDVKCVENIYYITNAKKIVALFDENGYFKIPNGLRQPEEGEKPGILVADGGL